MKRRDFLSLTAIGTGSLILASTPLGVLAKNTGILRSIGLQLYTVDKLLAQDFEAGIKKVADIGYKLVEFSTLNYYHGHSAKDIKYILAEYRLEAPNGRVRPKIIPKVEALPIEQQIAAWEEQMALDKLLHNIEAMLPAAKSIGHKSMILSFMPENAWKDRKGLDKVVNIFRQAGELCASEGIRFGYHHHLQDFIPVEGVIPLDFMINELDPDLFEVQLDTYWVAKAGLNPLKYSKRFPGRIQSCHLKDIGVNGQITDVGLGTLDFGPFIRAATDGGTQYFFVEHDEPLNPTATAVNSYNHLKSLRF